MSLEINILNNLHAMDDFLSDFKVKVAVQATRSAINRTLVSTRKEAVKTLRTRLNIKSTTLKRKHISLSKVRGGSLSSMTGSINFNDNPMPLLDFVKGHKNIIKQKGIKVKKRRKLKVEVVKGKKITLKTAFIQKVNSKQVFKRGSSGFKRQAVSSIGTWVSRRAFKKPIMREARARFNIEFDRQYSFRMDRALGKVKSSKVRKR